MHESGIGIAITQVRVEPTRVGDEQRADHRRIGAEASVECGGHVSAPAFERVGRREHSQVCLAEQEAAFTIARFGAVDPNERAGGRLAAAHGDRERRIAWPRRGQCAEFRTHERTRRSVGHEFRLPWPSATRPREAGRVVPRGQRAELKSAGEYERECRGGQRPRGGGRHRTRPPDRDEHEPASDDPYGRGRNARETPDESGDPGEGGGEDEWHDSRALRSRGGATSIRCELCRDVARDSDI